MRMLCKNTVSSLKIICLHLGAYASFRLIEPFLCITYFIQPFRNQRRIRCLCLQLPVRGIPPFIRQYGKPVSFIQTVNTPIQSSISRLPGAKILSHSHVIKRMPPGKPSPQFHRVFIVAGNIDAASGLRVGFRIPPRWPWPCPPEYHPDNHWKRPVCQFLMHPVYSRSFPKSSQIKTHGFPFTFLIEFIGPFSTHELRKCSCQQVFLLFHHRKTAKEGLPGIT